MTTYTASQFMTHCYKHYGSLSNAAKHYGVSLCYVSFMASGRRPLAAWAIKDMDSFAELCL